MFHYSERDLETAILRDIESFLLEMGRGFSFSADPWCGFSDRFSDKIQRLPLKPSADAFTYPWIMTSKGFERYDKTPGSSKVLRPLAI